LHLFLVIKGDVCVYIPQMFKIDYVWFPASEVQYGQKCCVKGIFYIKIEAPVPRKKPSRTHKHTANALGRYLLKKRDDSGDGVRLDKGERSQ